MIRSDLREWGIRIMSIYKPLTILFLSTGNAARSIMAEALLRHKGSDRFLARSAGYKPLPAVEFDTLSLLQSEGISTDGLHTKKWSEFWIAGFLLPIDVIVTLSPEARDFCPKWPDNPVRVHWPVDDPLGAEKTDVREWKYRKCFAVLESRISSLVRTKVSVSQAQLLLQLKNIGMAV